MEGALLLLRWLFGFVIHAVIAPVWISYKYIDVLWPALLFAIVFTAFVFLILNKMYAKPNISRTISNRISNFAVCVLFFSAIYFYGSKVCPESYIQSIAVKKYNNKEVSMNVDYRKIFYYPIYRYDYIGSAHAHICIGNNKYNWSFRERDFYNANTGYSCEK